jgi:uncharacterized protein YodC (DUF2158 family)
VAETSVFALGAEGFGGVRKLRRAVVDDVRGEAKRRSRMRQEELTEGSRVRLRSGGPTMTVASVTGTPPLAACVWFDKGRTMKSANITPEALELVEP